jgi:hypothetical protein
MNFAADHWKDLLEIAGVIGALWKYFDTRASELAWKRTATLFALGDQFARDPDMAEGAKLVQGRVPNAHIDQLYDERGEPYDDLHGPQLWQVDKFLDFLARVAYAYRQMGTLTLAEVGIFGGDFQHVHLTERLRKYCLAHGYAVVADVAAEIVATPRSTQMRSVKRMR